MISYEKVRQICLDQPGAEEDFPFGPDTRVFKIIGKKMFALMPVEADPPTINLKCDPFHARLLRENYEAVQPGYHMNKKHWNTVTIDGAIPDDEVIEMVEESYALVLKGMSNPERDSVKKMTR